MNKSFKIVERKSEGRELWNFHSGSEDKLDNGLTVDSFLHEK